ncbi:MAG: HD domain-containing protein [Firmicutes bacterium]|nr:HD domain-containing protein [Bacillota bacterium]
MKYFKVRPTRPGIRVKNFKTGRANRQEIPLSITERLNFEQIPLWVREVADQLQAKGWQAFLVGGAVRDLLWGDAPQDWDLATDALPQTVEEIFPRTIPTGKTYGAITVLSQEHPVEVTTFRADLRYEDGRHPAAICFENNIYADLSRRDFTINAIAYNFATGALVDPFDGRRDAYRRILKTVGDPQLRFAEDGLRMFRFFRFLATRKLRPHPGSLRAIQPQWAEPVSLERIRDEFSKLLLGDRVRFALKGLIDSGLIRRFLPELVDNYAQLDPALGRALRDHLLAATEAVRPKLHLRLAALLHDLAKPATISYQNGKLHFLGHDEQGAALCAIILKRLRYPGKTVATVSALVRWHMFGLPPEASDGAVRRFIAKVGPELIPDLLELRRADIVATGRIDRQTPEMWRALSARFNDLLASTPPPGQFQLAINGTDLMERFHLNPGPFIGAILKYLWGQVLEDPALNQNEILFKKAAEYIRREGLKT